ncbi:unnamed protein product [Durusdinium trenchii]|uniref:Uncharacterized protein n=2 Tax=Durusdinium trenchii TaxID=1381693 RepID=A0ABP0RAT3_9DINO
MTHGANANGVKVKGKKKSRDQEKKTVESLDNLTAVTTATSMTSTPYDSTGKLEMEQKEVKLLQLFRKVSMYGLDDLGHIFDFQRVGQLVDSSTSELLERFESFLDFDSLHGSQAEQHWHSILGAVFPELQELSLKNRLAALIQCGKRNMAASKFTFVEYFSGCGNLTKSFLAQEHLGAAFDFKYTSNHDCLTVEGLRLWFAALLSCGPKSFIWFAIECSSWVPLCLSQSLRHESNGYLGDTSKVFIQNGNAQMVVSSLLMFVACLLGHIVSLEQPLSSVLPLCDLMDTVLKFIGVSKTVCYLGAYGAKSVKPVQL